MTDVWYLLNDRVTYHSSYNTKISYGNTSTGELEVEYLAGCMNDIRLLVESEFCVHPVLTLGSDLFGKITWEQLKRFGCVMDEVAWSKRRTPFVFRLSNKEWQEDTFYRFQIDGIDIEIRDLHDYLCEHSGRTMVIAGTIASMLHLNESRYVRCGGRALTGCPGMVQLLSEILTEG